MLFIENDLYLDPFTPGINPYTIYLSRFITVVKAGLGVFWAASTRLRAKALVGSSSQRQFTRIQDVVRIDRVLYLPHHFKTVTVLVGH
jgi:hypothetical protein